jgi:ATP/maltotriose-dependent transcriptional regulator MalT
MARQLGDDRLLGRCLALAAMAGWFKSSGQLWPEAIAATGRAADTFWLPIALTTSATFQLLHEPSEARHALEEALETATATDNPAAAGLAGMALGGLLYLMGKSTEAIEVLERAAQTAAEAGYALAMVSAVGHSATTYAERGLFDDALRAAARADLLAQRTGVHHEFKTLQARALVAAARGDHETARMHAVEALRLSTIPPFKAAALRTAAMVALAAGDQRSANDYVEQITALSTTEGLPLHAASGSYLKACLARQQGDPAGAEEAAQQALQQAKAIPAWSTVTSSLELLAGLANDAGSHQEAARLFGAAHALRNSTGYQLCLTERDGDKARVRAALGDERFDRAFDEGCALTVEEAVAYARRGRGERKRPQTGWDSLTPTETQIVDLVCHGRTNAEIGRQLFVSPRTVQTHLTHIYSKLGVIGGRAGLASKAAGRN